MNNTALTVFIILCRKNISAINQIGQSSVANDEIVGQDAIADCLRNNIHCGTKCTYKNSSLTLRSWIVKQVLG